MKGILVMAYGGPATMADVESYYTHIRGGKKPSQEQLRNLEERYRAIGGPSPLIEITRRQAAGLQRELGSDGRVRVFAGMKHSPPFIGDVVAEAAREGVDELLCIALAPHYSRLSVGEYRRAVEEAAKLEGGRVKVSFVESWHARPEFIAMWVALVKAAAGPGASHVVFSAHSLPERIVREGDPYRAQLLESSWLIAGGAGVKDWSFAFQSASSTGEPWLGPDILAHLGSLRRDGVDEFVLAPVGFVSDHLEILYDLDVECMGWGASNSAKVRRCELPNDSPAMLKCLASIARDNGFA